MPLRFDRRLTEHPGPFERLQCYVWFREGFLGAIPGVASRIQLKTKKLLDDWQCSKRTIGTSDSL